MTAAAAPLCPACPVPWSCHIQRGHVKSKASASFDKVGSIEVVSLFPKNLPVPLQHKEFFDKNDGILTCCDL